MSPLTCKLGLVLPEGLHARMIAQAMTPGQTSPSRGAVQAVYARAFANLLEALADDQPVTFAAVRGAKARVTVRLAEPLCAQIRARLGPLNLKLTDFAFAAVDRFLTQAQGR